MEEEKIKFTTNEDKQCLEINPISKVRFGLPKGHTGQHQNAYLTAPWDTE